MRFLLFALVLPLAAQPFVEKPYLQIGDAPKGTDLMLIWHAADADAKWKVEVKEGAAWREMAPPRATVVKAPGIDPHRVYRAALTGMKAGAAFTYRVSQNDAVVFEAAGRGRKDEKQAYRFVTFGDTAQDTAGERAVAYQTSLMNPDFVFITGDIVYSTGRISEYRTKYFPVFNADEASAARGAPLIRSVPVIAAVGNHDSARTNFQKFGDALAYFLYWDQPLNGPMKAEAPKNTPNTAGNDAARPDFLAGAENRFPRMANFSFDYGNAHWLVLDSNTYSDWTDDELRAWVKKDLDAAQGATWRFVGFHHPPFNSAKTHFDDQWMRVLCDVFEQEKVDVVFAGHVHNYQRTFPLTFVAKPQTTGKMVATNGDVAGEFKFDKQFGNGQKSKPKGVVYVINGGGGASLYNPEMQKTPEAWQPFTEKFVSEVHSLTIVDIDGKKMKVRQVSETGETVDSWQIAK
jgi:3',5'-cyclic AMP phosphodiesterase CpdA